MMHVLVYLRHADIVKTHFHEKDITESRRLGDLLESINNYYMRVAPQGTRGFYGLDDTIPTFVVTQQDKGTN